MRERVSVIIPSYNYGHFVVAAVESALSQTYPDLEVIVVDDGSQDDTAHRLSSFGTRIRYVYQDNQGLSSARNTGIRMATGEWIALLDADDLWHPHKTESQLNLSASSGDVGLIGSPPAKTLPLMLPSNPTIVELSVRDYLLSSRTGTSGALIRRQCFDRVGLFDESLTSIEDRDMWLRISANFRTIQIATPCWWYRPHEGQMSRRASRMVSNYKKVLTKFFLEHPEHQHLRRLGWSYLYLDGGWSFLDEGDLKTARAMMLRSVCLWPWSLGDNQIRKFPRARILARLLLGDSVFRRLADVKRRRSVAE